MKKRYYLFLGLGCEIMSGICGDIAFKKTSHYLDWIGIFLIVIAIFKTMNEDE